MPIAFGIECGVYMLGLHLCARPRKKHMLCDNKLLKSIGCISTIFSEKKGLAYRGENCWNTVCHFAGFEQVSFAQWKNSFFEKLTP